MSGVNRYLEEYNKFKHIKIDLNGLYLKKHRTSERIEVVFIDEEYETALIKNLRTENVQNKTLHWCRKNLIKVEDPSEG